MLSWHRDKCQRLPCLLFPCVSPRSLYVSVCLCVCVCLSRRCCCCWQARECPELFQPPPPSPLPPPSSLLPPPSSPLGAFSFCMTSLIKGAGQGLWELFCKNTQPRVYRASLNGWTIWIRLNYKLGQVKTSITKEIAQGLSILQW